MSKTDKHI